MGESARAENEGVNELQRTSSSATKSVTGSKSSRRSSSSSSSTCPMSEPERTEDEERPERAWASTVRAWYARGLADESR